MIKFNREHISVLIATILLGVMLIFPIWQIQVKSDTLSHTEYYSIVQLLFSGFSASNTISGVRFTFAVAPLYILLFVVVSIVGYIFLCSSKRFNVGIIMMCVAILSIFIFNAILGNIDSQELLSAGYSAYSGMNFYFLIPSILLIVSSFICNHRKDNSKEQVKLVLSES